jgi:hypothetical protein
MLSKPVPNTPLMKKKVTFLEMVLTVVQLIENKSHCVIGIFAVIWIFIFFKAPFVVKLPEWMSIVYSYQIIRRTQSFIFKC